MSERTLKVTLPDSIYDRIEKTARATSLTSEEVIKQSVILLLPAFESDLPLNHRQHLEKLSLLNDIQLWKIANLAMQNSKQVRLEKLAEVQKQRNLSENELSEMENLMDEAREIMLCKAEARRLLAQRGHDMFKSGH